MYPIFPWLKDRAEGRTPSPDGSLAVRWAALALCGAAVLAGLAALAARNREPPWSGADAASDQAYMRGMAAHHEQGIEIAAIAAKKAQNPHLRALARLMAAEQAAENQVFYRWWRSWFDIPFEVCSAEEAAAMPGMLTEGQMHLLRKARGAPFDPLFIELMSFHHAGAVAMADEEMRGSGDIRLRVMAQAIRHGQQGEIAMMQGAQGLSAVSDSVRDLFEARTSVLDLLKMRRRPLRRNAEVACRLSLCRAIWGVGENVRLQDLPARPDRRL